MPPAQTTPPKNFRQALESGQDTFFLSTRHFIVLLGLLQELLQSLGHGHMKMVNGSDVLYLQKESVYWGMMVPAFSIVSSSRLRCWC